jgi:hypothetical protein
LAMAIPISELILIKCYFFLDTIFLGFYTFVNCKVSLAGSMSTRQRENRNNGNQESSSKEASEEGSQENSKEEVSRQRNRQHNRGTPKASPDVFLVNAISSVFMRLQRTLRPVRKFCGGCARRVVSAAVSLDGNMRSEFRVLPFPDFAAGPGAAFTAAGGENMGSERGRRRAPGSLPEESECPSYQSGTGPCHL